MASISVYCACGFTHYRRFTASVHCACGFTHSLKWYEFPQLPKLQDQEADRLAFLCLPFSALMLEGGEDKEEEEQEEKEEVEEEDAECHPFWNAIQNAREEKEEEVEEEEDAECHPFWNAIQNAMAPSQRDDGFARRLHELSTEVEALRLKQDLLRERCAQNRLLD
jgi:ribosomal protein L31